MTRFGVCRLRIDVDTGIVDNVQKAYPLVLIAPTPAAVLKQIPLLWASLILPHGSKRASSVNAKMRSLRDMHVLERSFRRVERFVQRSPWLATGDAGGGRGLLGVRGGGVRRRESVGGGPRAEGGFAVARLTP